MKCITTNFIFNPHSCKEDHYGIASERDCKPCECDLVGSEISKCNINNGQCKCKELFVGRTCNTCKVSLKLI